MTDVDGMLPHAPHKTVTRHGLAARVGVATRLTMLALLLLLLLHVSGMSATARADVEINSAVTGPVSGDGGTFTVTATGAISGGTEGVLVADSATAITTLTNAGGIEGTGYGIRSAAGTSIGTISNLLGATITGTNEDGVSISGTVTSLSNAGTISGGSRLNDGGIELLSSGTVGTLTNTGSITGSQAVRTTNTSGIGSLVNSGTIRGTRDGVQHEGNTITSLVNQEGGLIQGDGDTGLVSASSSNFGTIDNAGTITGAYGVYARGDIVEFINRGTGVVSGTKSGYGFYTRESVGTFTNEAGGLIQSADDAGVYLTGDETGVVTFTNAGTISGVNGIYTDAKIGTLTNTATGLIQGTESGLYIDDYESVTVINAGRFSGGSRGIFAFYGIAGLTNKDGGEISGTTLAGLDIQDAAGTITNEAGGLITSADGAGVFVRNYSEAVVESLSNAGTIDGGTAGVHVTTKGTIKQLTNSGTIRYTGAGTGPAVLVGTDGILGVADGSSGVALTSTGVGALLDGTIENGGTIHYGFTIENQNVTVSAGGGTGTFTNGTLAVADGNLLFTSGVLALDADVSVNGGTGLFTNEATLSLGDAQTVTGNFAQAAAGTFRSVISGTSTYGNLEVNGTASFAGILDLALSEFTLAEGQTFDLFEFNSRTGDFSGLSVDGTSLASAGVGLWTYDSLVLQEVWTPTSMSISAVPEPSTLALGAAGLASAAWLRHRRRRAAAPQA
jgi:hypothetical protein